MAFSYVIVLEYYGRHPEPQSIIRSADCFVSQSAFKWSRSVNHSCTNNWQIPEYSDTSKGNTFEIHCYLIRLLILISSTISNNTLLHFAVVVTFLKGKGKGFPYSIPCVGPGADPGVQAVSLLVTASHPPGGRLPLLSARPAVTSPATEHHRPFGGYQVILLGDRGT